MNKSPAPKPTESELEILQVLWQHGPSTVRFVNDELSKKRDVGYTTTLKLLQLMLEKVLVFRDDESKTHIYRAAVREEETQGLLLDRFVESAFGGSAMKLVMQALGNRHTSQEELQQIRRLLNDIEIKNDTTPPSTDEAL
ncbi:BlaI/MecI/CopY family transcriptional regulator [Hymenobacter taeanensis]|uniref:BlaI/MecI/CopY family transcriptional regulator n=1 Tax=Hymenobacter taeanensis TaxID=2735321 RepID=A0A6M6BD19_9BACT|nr:MULTISPECIES: BlaI/MecI/CopY family transcriptional regulator [Hymenobacter]QJX45852.1 BlaI/MecI/CopY family transcriptional regulator [Hymenobacter taeanensis]UOQ79696.1 BlaI/MecI/CopY family transcriptional regulator [Hymenobacter sp. 5414T-23]